jgi:protein-disulfide isomerase
MRIIFAIYLALCVLTNNVAKADFNASDRVTLQTIIEEFIRNNPKVIRDTLVSLAAHEENERKKTGLIKLKDVLGDPMMGNRNGPVTIYEFSDYNCGYCKRIFDTIRQILNDNPDVRLVIKEFPILSQSSLVAAKAAIAAERQGKFNDFHIGLMTYRGQITADTVLRIAQEVGLDIIQLQSDMEKADTAVIIQRTRDTAKALNINGTPGIVIGDNVIPGAVSLEELTKLIDEERANRG